MGNLIEALCTTCAGTPQTDTATLCYEHHYEWVEEKAFGESWH